MQDCSTGGDSEEIRQDFKEVQQNGILVYGTDIFDENLSEIYFETTRQYLEAAKVVFQSDDYCEVIYFLCV
jgi:hypothetical protein